MVEPSLLKFHYITRLSDILQKSYVQYHLILFALHRVIMCFKVRQKAAVLSSFMAKLKKSARQYPAKENKWAGHHLRCFYRV